MNRIVVGVDGSPAAAAAVIWATEEAEQHDAGRPVDGTVVVGIDGSPNSIRAMRWAAAEASARSAVLHVVHAWQAPALVLPVPPATWTAFEGAARSVLDAALDDAAVRDVKHEGHLIHGGAAQALLHPSSDASLLVVGSRGTGRLRRTLLGSTSRQLAHHATCPVVVVPPLR